MKPSAQILKNYKIQKSYFADKANHGRTTTLLDLNGNILEVFVGALSKSDAVASYLKQQSKQSSNQE